MCCILLIQWRKGIHISYTEKNPQNDRLYASAAAKIKDTKSVAGGDLKKMKLRVITLRRFFN